MSFEEFEAKLIDIAGKNALGAEKQEVKNLCNALNYLKTQTAIMSSIDTEEERKEYRATIFEAATRILGRDD